MTETVPVAPDDLAKLRANIAAMPVDELRDAVLGLAVELETVRSGGGGAAPVRGAGIDRDALTAVDGALIEQVAEAIYPEGAAAGFVTEHGRRKARRAIGVVRQWDQSRGAAPLALVLAPWIGRSVGGDYDIDPTDLARTVLAALAASAVGGRGAEPVAWGVFVDGTFVRAYSTEVLARGRGLTASSVVVPLFAEPVRGSGIDRDALTDSLIDRLDDIGALKNITHTPGDDPTTWINAPVEVVVDELSRLLAGSSEVPVGVAAPTGAGSDEAAAGERVAKVAGWGFTDEAWEALFDRVAEAAHRLDERVVCSTVAEAEITTRAGSGPVDDVVVAVASWYASGTPEPWQIDNAREALAAAGVVQSAPATPTERDEYEYGTGVPGHYIQQWASERTAREVQRSRTADVPDDALLRRLSPIQVMRRTPAVAAGPWEPIPATPEATTEEQA